MCDCLSQAYSRNEIVALNRVRGALAAASAVMPPAICESLGLEAGASYGQGAAAAKAQWSQVSRVIVDEFRPVQNHPVG